MKQPTVAIIGTGFSGLCAAIQLKKKLGITAQLYEATQDIGGTWHYNTYPGCACDVASHLYSFSFELNPNWSKKFSSQKEIHQYMQHVSKKYGIYEQTQFETKVVGAVWLEDKKQWELELHQPTVHKNNQIKHFDFLFSCIGALRIPNVPEQFASFDGKIIHSAYWDNDYDFTNKRVAVIGSGTSAIQIIPNLAPRTKHLYSYQRTPTWCGPRNQLDYPTFIKWIFTYIPLVMFLYRIYMFFAREMLFGAWKDSNSWIANSAKNSTAKYMKDTMIAHHRQDLVDKLIPSFPVGCKRIGISDDYIPALCANNVSVNCEPISKVEGRTITTIDRNETEVDVLVLATGFNVAGFLGELKIYGRGGVSLNQLWDEYTAKTYKTVNVHGFPNFFITLGPGSALGHNSVVTIIESQVDFALNMMKYMIKNNIICMDPTEKAQEAFSATLQKGFEGTVWKGGCSSWYFNKHGDIQSLWPSSVIQFIRMLRNTDYKENFNLN